MEQINNFAMPMVKHELRKTGEEVEVIAFNQPESGARSDEDWVTYIDSEGKEHIREKLNMQLDFKVKGNNLMNSVLDMAKGSKFPSYRNNRVFEVAKELVINRNYLIREAVAEARYLVDEVGVEYE